MKEKVHDDYRKAAKISRMIYYAKWSDSILQICLWQNKSEWSNNDFWFASWLILVAIGCGHL